MKKPRIASALRALAVAGLLSGTALQAAAADLLADVKARGTLRVALEGTYPPFNFREQKSGELAGFDVDVARLLAERLGVRPEFITTEWSGILAGLAAGKYDVIVNQVAISDKRRQAFDFSEPYTFSSPQFIQRKDDARSFGKLDDFKGHRLGIGQGTNYEQKVRTVQGIQVRTYPGAPEYLRDLADGRIDGALNDSLMVAWLLKTSGLPLRPGALLPEVEKMGIPFRKGNPQFKAAIDAALAAAAADGSLGKISVKWFGTDVTRPAAQR